ncbi:MAG: 3-dehydroquinate synthase, partial [Akkermansia sp.]|nr:3-dehydroquinate synthase [Akkermansia sp.]
LTLPPRVLREGMAEIVKHAAIARPRMLQTLQRIANEIDLGFTLTTIEHLPELIAENIEIKARIVEADEKETQGVRAFLNLGHTLGHGIEASVPYGELLHGEVVSLGLRAALYLSAQYGGISAQEEQDILRTLKKLGLPLELPADVQIEKALAKTATDKKFINGAIRFVLLQSLGHPYICKEITQQDLRAALHHLTTPIFSI